MIVLKLFFLAKLITSKVSVTVPIWFGLIKIALAATSLMPLFLNELN
jgi:hypothetical protein